MRLSKVLDAEQICIYIFSLLILSANINASVIVTFGSEAVFNDASTKHSSKGLIFHQNNLTMEIFSVPIQFTSNPATFEPITATLLIDNGTIYSDAFDKIVYTRSVVPGGGFLSFESWAAWRWSRSSQRPAALIASGGAYAVGGLQVNKLGTAEVDRQIVVPVVHISQTSAEVLSDLLQSSGGILNVTLSDQPKNPFVDRRSGPVFIFYSVVLCGWALAIFVLSVTALSRRKIGKNLGTLCLLLDLLGACVRFVFGLDPFADRFMPAQVLDVLLTVSWTIVISGTILLLSFWHDLTRQVSMNITSVLDKNTKPTIGVIGFLFAIEIGSDILRCIRWNSDVVQAVVVIIYLIVAMTVSGFFIYVFIVVTRFLRDKGLGGRKESVLKTFSIRAIFCVAGFVLITIVGILYAAGLNYYEAGEGALNFMTHICINMVSTAQVTALIASSSSRGSTAAASSSRANTGRGV